MAWAWQLHVAGYAYRKGLVGGRRRTIYLHREVMGLRPGDGKEVDHENRNPLDCRRSNLTVTDRAGNQMNVVSQHRRTNAARIISRHRGVSWSHRAGKPWRARLRGKTLGYYATEEEAVQRVEGELCA